MADGSATIRNSVDLAPEIQRAPEFSDEHLALVFAARHADELRYVEPWKHWYAWDSKVWRRDTSLHAFSLARKACREMSLRAPIPYQQDAIASASTVAAVERLARADKAMVATVEQWDADDWLLNTPDGIVDLRTGHLRLHDPAAYMTKTTAVGPGGTCPTWLSFLDRVMASDAELVAFVQRLGGYILTGSTRAQVLAFLYGTGANGKSVLLSTLSGILGDYARVAPIETFTASNTDRHPTELAMLRGARLVTATETEEGRRWAESRIKALTGGDPVPARFMRGDFFEYVPKFKLVIAGNHKPGLRSVDEAIRRRFLLVPFSVTIPPAERDPELTQKLRAEWPGILAWFVEGCLAWQRGELAQPTAVVAATQEYLEAEDAIATWLAERCDRRDPQSWARSSVLYSDWKSWAERAGEFAGSQKRFSQALTGHLTRVEKNLGSGFQGVKLRFATKVEEDQNVFDGP